MNRLLPPLCLLLALASLISAFTLLATDAPEPSMKLHQARVEGDEDYRKVLEEDLEKRRVFRTILITGLFVSTGLFTVAAFLTMSRSA